jgi:multicomponent K+:H+ antiporter subunit A
MLRVVAVLGDRTPEYSLSVWHGLQHAAHDERYRADRPASCSIWLLRDYLRHLRGGPALLPRFRGQRIFDRILVTP